MVVDKVGTGGGGVNGFKFLPSVAVYHNIWYSIPNVESHLF